MTVSSQSECGWTADRAHAPVHDDECFLHHIFDDRGAVAKAPGVASNVRLQRHQELCERVPVARLCREQEIV
jgi:hypothetical protein